MQNKSSIQIYIAVKLYVYILPVCLALIYCFRPYLHIGKAHIVKMQKFYK